MAEKISDVYIKFYYPIFTFISRRLLPFVLSTLVVSVVIIWLSQSFELFPYSLYAVSSNSMEPRLEKGSLVIVQEVNENADLEKGDIITFKGSESVEVLPITHRIVSVKDDKYITKGDNNEKADPWKLDRSEIIGKVVYNIDEVGEFIIFSRTVLGIIVLMIIPATMLITLQLKDFTQSIEDRYYKIKKEGSFKDQFKK
jgi:signal peptidase